MTLTEKFNSIQNFKFSFSKSTEFSQAFARDCGAASMYDLGFGLNIQDNLTPEYQLRAVFFETINLNGLFLFNLSGVDINKSKKGFENYDEADFSNQITEWELFMIIKNEDYLKRCIFHNGKVEFKKKILWNLVK